MIQSCNFPLFSSVAGKGRFDGLRGGICLLRHSQCDVRALFGSSFVAGDASEVLSLSSNICSSIELTSPMVENVSDIIPSLAHACRPRKNLSEVSVR